MYSSQLQLKFSNVSEAKIAAQSLCELLKSRISVFDFHGLQVTVGKDGDLSISVRFQDVKAMNDFEKDIPADRKEDWRKSLTVERCFARFLRQSPEKKKLWFSQHTSLMSNPDWRQEVLDQKVLSNDMAFLGAVVFGGYLVDENLVNNFWIRSSVTSVSIMVCFRKLELSMTSISPDILSSKP